MQVSSKSLFLLVGLTSLVFLISPLFMTLFIAHYNNKKRKYIEEKEQMKAASELELTKAQIEVQDQTMETIATDLHDNIGQLLSVTSLTLASINLTNQVKAAEKITVAHELVNRSIVELRHLARLMQASTIIELGLEDAIRNELAYIEKSGRYKVSFQCENFNKINTPEDKEIIIFRICQELLNNILKHANATEIKVSLSACSHKIILQVADNGKGFKNIPDRTDNKGIGLQNIKKRTAILGGTIIFLDQERGSAIEISVPIPPFEIPASI